MRRVPPVLLVAAALFASPASSFASAPGALAPDLELGAAGALLKAEPLGLPAQLRAEPPVAATPRATCREGSRPEPSIQGRLPKEEVDSGRADQGYWCNIRQIGRSGSTGGFRVHRYVDKAGRECAYYDTALLFPTNLLSGSGELSGVAVLDMSDPAKPVRTDTLVTPAMQTPHESVSISVKRGVLAAVLGNPGQYPGAIDLYDISQDCRHPVVKSTVYPATPYGHESGIAPDGLTFYPSSPGSQLSAVDISDLSAPKTLVTTDLTSHGLSVSDDGRRGYWASLDGLIITDLSEVQDRKPNPQIREISRLTWSNMTIPQTAIPVTVKGRKYLVEVDEYSTGEDGSGVAGNGARVGAARIIDVQDETKPFVVSNLRLAVHQPENRDAIAGDPGAQSPVQGYAGHYCNVPQREEPGIVACSMINSGLRVFDIRDPAKPKEIAYFMSPPSTISLTGSPVIDEKSDWAMSQPAFAPERGEIWYSDGNSGFYALKMDPAVWPFPKEASGSCTATNGLRSVGVSAAAGGLKVRLQRAQKLPVDVDVFRVSSGRTVLRERRVASSRGRGASFRLRGSFAPGLYFARYRMRDAAGKVVDTQRVTFERTRSGVRARPPHYAREGCGLVRSFKLERPAFCGTSGTPLQIAYRLAETADVTVTVRRGGRVVKQFTRTGDAAGRAVRLSLPSAGLARGDHSVTIVATAGERQFTSTLVSRRL